MPFPESYYGGIYKLVVGGFQQGTNNRLTKPSTAFSIGGDFLITAHHAVDGFSGKPRARIFNANGQEINKMEYFVAPKNQAGNYLYTGSSYDPYDFVILKTATPLESAFTFTIADVVPDIGTFAGIIGFKASSYAISENSNEQAIQGRVERGIISYNLQTFQGQSGAPILNSIGQVIGVHTEGADARNRRYAGGVFMPPFKDWITQKKIQLQQQPVG
jgi:V8-like Glu-specific endopeptidase